MIAVVLLLPFAFGFVSRSPKHHRDFWIAALWLYVALALISFIPVWRASRRKVTKKDVDESLFEAGKTVTKARPLQPLDDPTKQPSC